MSFEKEISSVQYLLWILGVWGEQNIMTKIFFSYSFTLSFACSIVYLSYSSVYEIEEDILETIALLCVSFKNFITLCLMKIEKRKTEKIFNWMKDNWDHYNTLSKKSQIVMHQERIKAQYFVRILGLVVILIVIGMIFGPLWRSFKTNLPIFEVCNKAWFSILMKLSFSDRIIYTIQSLSFMNFSLIYMCFDSWIYVIIRHIRGQLRILYNKIENYEESNEHIDRANESQAFHNCDCLKCIVDRHNSIIEAIDNLEDYTNTIIWSRFFIIGVQISTLGYIVIAGKTSFSIRIITIIIYCMLLLGNSFMYGWLGEQLTQSGYAIGDALYSKKWYEFNQPKTKKTFKMMIHRAQTPLKITVGKFFPLSLKLVAQSIMTWVSYLSVLNAVIQQENQQPVFW